MRRKLGLRRVTSIGESLSSKTNFTPKVGQYLKPPLYLKAIVSTGGIDSREKHVRSTYMMPVLGSVTVLWTVMLLGVVTVLGTVTVFGPDDCFGYVRKTNNSCP